MTTPAYRNTSTRDRHRRTIRGRRDPCGICGGDIDYALRRPHPQAFEVDHILALVRGGADTLDNKQASHQVCNRTKGAGVYVPSAGPKEPITTWRRWWNEGVVPA